MRLLVLGNGFDIDHNLPTGYIDFLNFCNSILEIDVTDSELHTKLTASQLDYLEECRKDKSLCDAFISYIKKNCMITYFNNRSASCGDKWIDFEREIKYVVNVFRDINEELINSRESSLKIDSNHISNKVLRELGYEHLNEGKYNELLLNIIHKMICDDYDKFVKAFELYIALFINKTTIIGVSPDIIDFNADRVLSFNYSNTYERVYSGTKWHESIDHIHGIALSELNEKSHIILGISSTEEEYSNGYVEFEKFFQRITQKTDYNHKSWLQSIGSRISVEVMFFGHSLDSTDEDIITEIINRENTSVSIYYYNESAHNQIVANLVKQISKETLIKYVSGSNPKIKLIKQRTHQNDSDSGIGISRDIKAVYRLHELSNICIDNLLTKIQEKVKESDISYFNSQRNAISLFEALKYQNIDRVKKEDLFEICKLLEYETDINGNLIYLREEEWYYNAPWEEDPCNIETLSLVNRVNEWNTKRFKADESRKVYAELLNKKDIEEIKDGLLALFSTDNPSEDYWEQLSELLNRAYDNEYFEKAIKQLREGNYSIYTGSKVKRFVNMYDKLMYDVDCQNHTKDYNSLE